MKDLNTNALLGILMQRVLSALNLTKISIEKFCDIVSMNKTYMCNAQRYYGKAEAYLDITKVISDETYQALINTEMYKEATKLLFDAEDKLNRY